MSANPKRISEHAQKSFIKPLKGLGIFDIYKAHLFINTFVFKWCHQDINFRENIPP